jgi:TPR repeat protein
MRHFFALAAFTLLTACATNVVAEKASRFDQGVAAYDAGDHATAYRIWDELARDNDLAAMRNVAQLLRQGKGVAKDTKRAFKLYMDAAEKGLVTAMANVGDMYLSGEGVEKNAEAAAAWYARAATAGLSLAQWKLAEMYESGNGIPRDPDRARSLLERAARNGYAPAQAKLKAMGVTLNEYGEVVPPPAPENTDAAHQDGGKPGLFDRIVGGSTASPKPITPQPAVRGMSPGDPISPDVISKMAQADLTTVYAGVAAYGQNDKKAALSIWHSAAVRGISDAQLRVGLMYERGEGAPQDAIEAYRWLRHAVTQGHPLAIAELARISAKLAPAERAIGESLVREPVAKAKKPN